MAIGGVVINFALKTRDAIRDAASLSRGLEDVSDEARDLDRALGAAESEIDSVGSSARGMAGDLAPAERSFEQLAAEAQQAAADMRREMGNMSGAVRDGAADVDVEARKMKTDLGEVGRESGAEFIGNIAEGIGSGSGSLDDVVQGTLGGLTNLAASMTGPVALAGAAAAAGIGLVFAASRKEAERSTEKINGLIGELEGLEKASQDAVREVIWNQWYQTISKSPDKIAKITANLKMANVPAGQFKDAISGSASAQEEVRKKLVETTNQIKKQVEAGEPITQDQATFLENQKIINGELGQQNKDLDGMKQLMEDTEYLTGVNMKATGKWEDNMKGVKGEAKGINTELDKADNRKLNVSVEYTSKGNPYTPVAPTRPYSMPPAGVAAAAYGAPPPPPNVTINYNAGMSTDPYRDARIIKRMLEGEDMEQGRRRGAPLAVSW